jgi:hypothetical protein
MSVIENGVIQQLSVSQLERFDPEQPGGCPTAWFLERKHHQKPDSSAAKDAGDAGHGLFATHFRGNPLPTRAKMLKHVRYAILKGDLPKPGPDMLVEWRGDGQEKFSQHTCSCDHPNSSHEENVGKCSAPGCDCEAQSPKWIPLLKATTLHLGGIPFELFIDLAYRRGDVPTVIDHKFSSDPVAYAKTDDEIVETIQMPVYVLGLQNRGLWQDAKRWQLLHNYNGRTAGTQFFRGDVFSMDQILERKADIEERVIPAMKAVAKIDRQEDVPFNRRACEMWHGCPLQSVCHAYRGNKMSLSQAEADLFKDLEPSTAPSPAALTAPPADPPKVRRLPIVDVIEDAQIVEPEDEEAKLEAEHRAKMAKLKAEKERIAKEKADAAAKAAAAAEAAAQIPDSKVLPPDAPKSDPALAADAGPMPDPKSDGGQPAPASAKGKGAKPAPVGPATVTVTMTLEVFDRVRGMLK